MGNDNINDDCTGFLISEAVQHTTNFKGTVDLAISHHQFPLTC
jgi:hypothetical protein